MDLVCLNCGKPSREITKIRRICYTCRHSLKEFSLSDWCGEPYEALLDFSWCDYAPVIVVPRRRDVASSTLGEVLKKIRGDTNIKLGLAPATKSDHRPRGSAHYRAKLTEEQVVQIRELKSVGASLKELAYLFDVSSSTVQQVLYNKNRWKHVK